MHDIWEGVAKYILRSIIYEFIFVKRYFDLAELNHRIQSFNYGSFESNKPPIITLNTVKNKLVLKCSASEMMCLVRYFGIIIGDSVDEKDPYWLLYKYLRAMVDIILSPRITESLVKEFENRVPKFNALCIKLFGSLKRKFHLLVHYARLFVEFGPLIFIWCMRFESKHRQLKAVANATSCSKNLLKTIAIKQMLKMCAAIDELGKF